MPGQVRQPGDVIGDYRLARVINEGQMTRTWEAEQISMQRPVMLEMLKSASAADEEIVRAFLEFPRATGIVHNVTIQPHLFRPLWPPRVRMLPRRRSTYGPLQDRRKAPRAIHRCLIEEKARAVSL